MKPLRVFFKSIFLLLIVLPIDCFTLAQASQSSSSVRFVPPPPPLQGRPTGSRRGGASRGNCPAGERQLTALAPAAIEPAAGAALESVGGLTTAERPTFWFYLPYGLTDDRPGEFVLLDDEDNYVYRATIAGSDWGEGIVGVPLPASIAPLAVDRTYHWTFLVYCEADNPTFTQGYIQRVAPATPPEAATTAERAAQYANSGIWYDALTTLAELYRANPSDAAIAAEWQTLLQSVGLGELADRPLLACCTPEPPMP